MERIISSLQGCRSSDTVFSCDCSGACPSPKKAAWCENCLRPYNGFPFLWTMSLGDIQCGCGPWRNPTVFSMRWVSFTSRTCLARSSPKRNFAEDFVSEEQRAWYSGFKAGFICSCRKIDISLAACPNKATISMLLVSSSFFAGPLKSEILRRFAANWQAEGRLSF